MGTLLSLPFSSDYRLRWVPKAKSFEIAVASSSQAIFPTNGVKLKH